MGIDVRIPGSFTATGLPLRPGWEDTFNRPDSTTLGSTSEGGRPWRVLPSAGATVTPSIQSQSLAATGSTGFVVASADAGVADVRIEATVTTLDTASALTPNLRLAVRCNAANPPHFVSLRWTNTTGVLTINSYVPGQTGVTVNSTAQGNLLGKRLALEAVGDTFAAYVNNVRVIAPQTILGLRNVTHHGIQANNSANAVRLDDMTVTRV